MAPRIPEDIYGEEDSYQRLIRGVYKTVICHPLLCEAEFYSTEAYNLDYFPLTPIHASLDLTSPIAFRGERWANCIHWPDQYELEGRKERWEALDELGPNDHLPFDASRGRIDDRVEIARAALLEAGFPHIAQAVYPNRGGNPSYRGPIRTEEELRALTRAIRLGHLGDEEGKPVICCAEVPEFLIEQALANGGYIAACDHCTMHEEG